MAKGIHADVIISKDKSLRLHDFAICHFWVEKKAVWFIANGAIFIRVVLGVTAILFLVLNN